MSEPIYNKRGQALTIKQKKFLLAYRECLNIREAMRTAGMRSDALNIGLRKKTLFADLFRELQKNIINDPRFTKAGSIGKLTDLQAKAESNGDYKLSFEIQKEINKMIDGNLAVQKVLNEKTETLNITMIDLTKKEPVAQLEQTTPVDTEYEDVTNQEEDE